VYFFIRAPVGTSPGDKTESLEARFRRADPPLFASDRCSPPANVRSRLLCSLFINLSVCQLY
jgi:hypothetical protein